MGRPRCFLRLAAMILACYIAPTSGCPSDCRCYSLTVECGSLGLKEVPPGVLSATEVSRPIYIKHCDPLAARAAWPASHISVFAVSHLPHRSILISLQWLWLIYSPWPSQMCAWGRGHAVGCVIIHLCLRERVVLCLWSSVAEMFNTNVA